MSYPFCVARHVSCRTDMHQVQTGNTIGRTLLVAAHDTCIPAGRDVSRRKLKASVVGEAVPSSVDRENILDAPLSIAASSIDIHPCQHIAPASKGLVKLNLSAVLACLGCDSPSLLARVRRRRRPSRARVGRRRLRIHLVPRESTGSEALITGSALETSAYTGRTRTQQTLLNIDQVHHQDSVTVSVAKKVETPYINKSGEGFRIVPGISCPR